MLEKKTVVFLCGLIGSGKTTYAIKKFKNFTDLDYMNPYARKIDQIRWTLRLLERNNEVCHITTYPTEEELRAFNKFDRKFLLMNTSVNQANTNILIRNRPRDMANVSRVFKANVDLMLKYQKAIQAFELINNYGEAKNNG